ncbi:MAG TPA: hypothetical protein VKZ53_30860 [Candidatus Angelobacter sp.]|nr:hypothetical protein [Candidatus Angelobacter sp.]
MPEDKSTPQINSAKLGIGGSIAGAIFTVGSLVVFLEGVPVLRYLFPGAILLGLVVAFALHFIKKETPGSPWLLAATEKETFMPERECNSKILGSGVTSFAPFQLPGQEPRFERYGFLVDRIDYADAFTDRHWSTFCFFIDADGALRYCQQGTDH